MPPKPKARGRRATTDDLFHYNNQVELTFKKQRKVEKLDTVGSSASSSSDEEVEVKTFRKSKIKSASLDSPSSSDLEDLTCTPSKLRRNEVNDSIEEVDVIPTVIERPVTPPPPDEVFLNKFSRQGLKMSRDLDNKIKSLQAVTQQEPSPITLRDSEWSDVVVVDKSVASTLSDREITLRVRTSKCVERFRVLMSDTFEGIMCKLAQKNGVPVETVSLSFTDTAGSFQTLKSSDCPLSVNLSCADILECHIVHPVTDAPSYLDEDNDENVINIKIQGSDSNSTKLFKILKNEPLGNIMQQYADFRKIDKSRIRFCFDGEDIQPNETPEDLDMDEENMVEVVIS